MGRHAPAASAAVKRRAEHGRAPIALVGWSRARRARRGPRVGGAGHDVVVVEDALEAGFDALTESIAGRDLVHRH